MSQKQALAIFATSFLAGLLVTVVVFEPFSITPTTSPYFGFPGESEDLGAQNIRVFLEPGIASKSSTPPVAEIFDLPNSPNELAESFSKTIQEHLRPPSEISTNTISFPQAVMLSTEEILSLENLAKRANNGSVSVHSILCTLELASIANKYEASRNDYDQTMIDAMSVLNT